MKRRNRILVGLAAVALAGFALLQCFNPPRTNPPATADFAAALHPPATVAASLRAACYDCHSAETVWPWYAHVAPLSWQISDDVDAGRERLNFSDWPADPARAAKDLDRINEVLDYREMPPKKYTLLHASARLTEPQRKELMDWTETTADTLRTPTR